MSRNFKCEYSEDFGRYLISEKRFEQGQLVWEERPLVSGPVAKWKADAEKKERVYTCVSCYKEVDDCKKCARCLWPCCSFRCSQSEDHKNLECEIISTRRILVTRDNLGMLIYLRILLCKRWEQKRYGDFLNLYFKESEEDEELVTKREHETKMIWKFLTLECGLKVSMEEVSRIHSVFLTNNFVIGGKNDDLQYNGAAAYHYGSLFAHSCEANLEFIIRKLTDGVGDTHWVINMIAKKSIEVGENLTISYSGECLHLGTVTRQSWFLKCHSFICKCHRCKDNTEGGTYFQAMLCPECDPGNLLPVDAMTPTVAPWSCDKCECTRDANLVMRLLGSLENVPYSLAGDEESLKLADDFIEEQRILLHPNHFLMNMCAMHWLLQSDFTDQLLSPGKGAEQLFVKIIKRVEIYLPLCLRFMSYFSSYRLYYVVANAYAAFALKSDDLLTFGKDDYTLRFKLRLSRRIASFIQQSLVWTRLNPYIFTESSFSVHLHWSELVRKMEEEIEQQETLALMSLRFLFLEI